MIGGSVVQSVAAEDMSYDNEHHVLWLTATATSLLSGRIRAMSGVYITRDRDHSGAMLCQGS